MKTQKIIVDVPIPGADLKTIVRTIPVEVEAEWSETLNDYLLDGYATAQIERAKAREMGVLLPEQIKSLRERLGMTQKQMCELLRIGAKTWSRWENERERPSHSMNILLRALDDGKIDIPYLKNLQQRPNWCLTAAVGSQKTKGQPELSRFSTICSDNCCRGKEDKYQKAS